MSGYQGTYSSSYQPYTPSGIQMTNSTNYDTFPKYESSAPFNNGTTKTTFATTTQNNYYTSSHTPLAAGGYTSSTNQQPSSLYRSHLYEHNKNQSNDRLYEPLRNIVTHPEITNAHYT